MNYAELESISDEKLHWEAVIRDIEVRNQSLRQELEVLRQHDTNLQVQSGVLL